MLSHQGVVALFERSRELGVVAHTFNPSIWEADLQISEFNASLLYRAISRTARATQKSQRLNRTHFSFKLSVSG